MMEPLTHDTFVIGGKNGAIVFLKSYIYTKQKEEAQKDLEYVQDKSKFDFWFISHVGNWGLEHKLENGEMLKVNIPLPE